MRNSFTTLSSWLIHACAYCAVCLVTLLLVLLCLAVVTCRRRVTNRLRATQQQRQGRGKIVAFFHPHCSGGGGGERVLWKALQVLGDMAEQQQSSSSSSSDKQQQQQPPLIQRVMVYTIDPPTPHYARTVLQHAQTRFAIAISDKLKIQFVHLDAYKHLLDPAPRFSLIVESLGAMRLAWHGLQQSAKDNGLPHVFCDTTGCAFTFFPASLYFGCTVMAYVHYPTISTDMLQLVWERRRAAYNHDTQIASSRVQTAVKFVYYTAFAILYGAVGSCATVVLVNSTWTFRHIQFLWKGPAWRKAIRIVYPPCAVQDLQSLATCNHNKQRLPCIVSIGQFRPEKDHVLQLQAMARLLHQHATELKSTKLILMGSCRNSDDEVRLADLRQLAHELDIADHVEFCVNEPYATIKHWLGQASVGLHTMWNEHFGIGIVEMMAAGLLVVAHNSGGPRTDIITPKRTGFLASTVDEYATAMYQALTLPAAEATIMRTAAVASSQRFSDEVFSQSFRDAIVEAKIL